MIIAAVAVLIGVFYAATGRGGELAYEHADHAPLDLGPVSAADVAVLRPPTALWGYNMQVTDEALETIARAMRDRDVTIAYLRQQLVGQGSGAAPGPDAPLTPPTGPQFSLASQTTLAPESPAASQTAPAPESPAASQTAPAPESPAASQTVPAPQVPPPFAGPEQSAGPKHARPAQRWSNQEPASSQAPAPDEPGPAGPAAPAEPAAPADSAASPAPQAEARADNDALARVEEQSW
jgi:hypothetical protein